ncbi:MAG: transposase [candidate division WOR-3 bacterium]
MTPEEVFREMLRAYGARWKIEEFHRQMKQDFRIENVQMKRYEALRNMMTIVWTIASYFVLQGFKRLMIEIIRERMSNKKQRQYLKKEWRYIYYRIFEELNYWFTQIQFRRGVRLESNEKTKFISLFPEMEVSL